MRIVCEKCAAAYAIDDRLITARGVRAQCPRCRHLQFVTRESVAASSEAQRTPAITPLSKPQLRPEALPGSTPSAAPRIPSAAQNPAPPPPPEPSAPEWDVLPPPPPEADDSFESP